MTTPSSPPLGAARVARLCPPGKWWYLAVCEACAWAGMSWKDKGWAVDDAARHNIRHTSQSAPSGQSS